MVRIFDVKKYNIHDNINILDLIWERIREIDIQTWYFTIIRYKNVFVINYHLKNYHLESNDWLLTE